VRKIHVKQTIVIHLPVEDIFAYMSNLEHLLDWSSGVISVKTTSSDVMRVGAMAKCTIRFLGMRSEMIFEIVECEPNRFLTLKSISGVTPCLFYYQFETLEDGVTSIAQDSIFSFITGFADLAERAVINALHRQLEHDLLTLKDMLEIYTPTCLSVTKA
jgi:uncharacterized membrane protein